MTLMNDKRERWQHKAIKLEEIDFKSVKYEFRRLISSTPSEQAVQKYIEKHSYLLLQARNDRAHSAVVAKPKLADEFVTDFIMFGGCNNYWVTLVEIEKPSDSVFTKAGDYSSSFSHALRQVSDWKAWIRENMSLFSKYFSHPDTIRFEIILGRRENLKDAMHRFKAIDDSITISTFDSLLPSGNFGYDTRGGYIQKEAITFSDYKEIYNIGTGKDSHVNPWSLYWLWDHWEDKNT